MRSLLPLLLIPALSSAAWAQFPGNADSILLRTDEAVCDPERGRVEVDVDAYGAVGSAISSSSYYHYDPFDDFPDQEFVSTIFEWKTFLCRTDANGNTAGTWLEDDDMGSSPATVSVNTPNEIMRM